MGTLKLTQYVLINSPLETDHQFLRVRTQSLNLSLTLVTQRRLIKKESSHELKLLRSLPQSIFHSDNINRNLISESIRVLKGKTVVNNINLKSYN